MKSSENYHRVQTGYAILALTLTAEVSIIISCLKYGKLAAALLFSLILAFLAACFFSLQIMVDRNFVRLRFGIGLIYKEIPLGDILFCTRVKNFILSGWGVKRIGRTKGWSYSVSGFDAVELTLKNGQKIRIGTDDPEGLLENVNKRIG